jgi:dCMP deaminase
MVGLELSELVVERIHEYGVCITANKELIRRRPLTDDYCFMQKNELACHLRRDLQKYCKDNNRTFNNNLLRATFYAYIDVIAQGVRDGDTSVAMPRPAMVATKYEDEDMYKAVSDKPRERPSWTDYFMYITEVVKLRSPDPKTQVGAVLTTDDNRIISTGYNALMAGVDEHSIDWSERERDVYPRILHAEANALLFAQSRFKNSRLYCTYSPCRECLKLMAAAGVTKVVFQYAYRDYEDVAELAKELNIDFDLWKHN